MQPTLTLMSNVFLAGLLYLTPADYEALYRLSADISPEQGKASKQDVGATQAGELANDILQAACRGAVRRCEGEAGEAPKCSIYVIGRGVDDILRKVFPGATVNGNWHPPTKLHLKGLVKDAVEYISAALAKREFVAFSAVRNAIGMADASNFSKRIRGHDMFRKALERLGVEEADNRRGFVRAEHFSPAAL